MEILGNSAHFICLKLPFLKHPKGCFFGPKLKEVKLSPSIILGFIAAYFILLFIISLLTAGKTDNKTFFIGNRKSPWFLVAFGMIGASLSGVTFISIPGWVANSSFSYMQMVLGYLVGYAVISFVLLPLYYRLNLTSIYGYLNERFGFYSYKTGAAFFLLSRVVGASFRLFLVAGVLQVFVFQSFGIPFWLTVSLTLILIWIYTFRAGIKTIVYTDTLQTAFMLLSVMLCVYFMAQEFDGGFAFLLTEIKLQGYADTFQFENFLTNDKHFVRQFIAGALIAIVMTGLDQDMMQKNLSCKNLKDAQKNVMSMSIMLVPVNLFFLTLGAMLYVYAAKIGLAIPAKADHLFPEIALNHLPAGVGIVFILGLIAAAYSSADSALTALTTSFCVDFLGMEKNQANTAKQQRFIVHLAFSIILFFTILFFNQLGDDSVVVNLFKAAGYTYGPLLGLYSFGLITKLKVKDSYVPVICILAALYSHVINRMSPDVFCYTIGFEIILLNGALTFFGLLLITRNRKFA